MFDEPAFLQPRVSGNSRRGWGLVLLSVGVVAAGLVVIDFADRHRWSGDWMLLLPLTVVPACIGVWMGATELRRPIQMDASGRCRSRRIEGAELRWHATFPDIADDIRVVMERTSSSEGVVSAEVWRGRMNARLILDGPPFRPGTRVRMKFSTKAERDLFLPDVFDFQLRCLRETPRPLLRLKSGIECIAEAELTDLQLDETRGLYLIEFDLPADAPGSDLLAERPVYWELTVDGDGPFASVRGRFFIPVSS